jgi:DNA transposition AAA+ family ATPase
MKDPCFSSTGTPDEVRRLAQDFLRRTGMAPADFAHRIGYAYETFNQFLTGKYRRGPNSKESNMCEAVLDFLATARNDGPEQFGGKLYEIGNTRVMREILRRLCDRPCILMAYAPPGSGKTDVARALIPEFTKTGVEIFRVYCRAAITKRDLLRRIAVACGSIANIGIERTINNLRHDFADRRVVLYLDEAQHLSVECLETVRELYDELHWSLCFAGSHQLDKVFSTWAGDLEQLERRVTDKITLPAVTSDEADGIIRSELPGLSNAKVRAIIERSHVDVRVDRGVQRYLSIGRVMANIRELQELMPEAADAQRKPEITLATAIQEEVA